MKQCEKKTSVIYWLGSIAVSLITVIMLRVFIFGLYHVPTGSAEPNLLVGDRICGNKMAYYFGDVKRGDLVIFDSPEYRYDCFGIFSHWWQKYMRIPLWWMNLKPGPECWIKRVIGVPGDIVEGRIENGRTAVYLNGKKLNESYVNTFPLIRLKKRVGFRVNRFPLLASLIPSCLKIVEKEVDYSYDPLKPLGKQSFYYIADDELVRTAFSKETTLTFPFTPTYVMQNAFYGDIDCVDSFGPIVIPKGKYWVMGDNRKNSRDSRYWGLLDENLIHGRASFILFSIDSEESFWFFDLIKDPISFFTRRIRWKRFFSRLDIFNGKINA